MKSLFSCVALFACFRAFIDAANTFIVTATYNSAAIATAWIWFAPWLFTTTLPVLSDFFYRFLQLQAILSRFSGEGGLSPAMSDYRYQITDYKKPRETRAS